MRLPRIITLHVGLFVFAAATGLGISTAQAQVQTSTTPSVRLPSQGILTRFAPRGGIGTTPFLGNIRGLGANSINYDKVQPEVKSSFRSYNRRFLRRTR